MKMRSFLTMVIGTALLAAWIPASVALATETQGFSDVWTSHPNYEAIMGLKERGVIGGYPDGTFKPEQAVNRVEALKIILLGSGINVPETTGTGGFSDTQADAWYAKYILKAQILAIVQGYPDGTFKPEQTVNLVENLKMLLKAWNIDVSNLNVMVDPYADTPKDEWYAKYVQYAKDHNLIDADSQNKVYPAQGMTRAKLAETMYRLIYVNEHELDWYPPPEDREPPGVTLDVKIQDFAFSPKEMTVAVGTTVRWTNNDTTAHTVTSDSGDTLNSELLGKGDSYDFTFDEEGTYSYHCTPHPFMTGKIIVKPANEVPTI